MASLTKRERREWIKPGRIGPNKWRRIPQSIHWRTQRASAGPELLLHEMLSASPSFEVETVPPVQVIEASTSPEPQVSVQLLLQASCLTM